ncbi:hypothetical protein TH63_13465 [Rufibacter radiotolerans]|uniref:DUF4407 domain-containing protein n=2 Tax=Rufibacter radiotolerans TaxID=1379910 RepID=A0A0H4VM53_9BACT|nr:hypothetical protein TH63_13465 [Rufibacter radiotolerans]
MTCLFAALAGGFAAFRFSDGNWIATIVFGFVWGLLIFSIDRSMVVTLKKDPTKEKQSFWEPFLTRLVLAALLAFMISIPLEIKIFEKVINIQLDEDIQNSISNYGSKLKDNTGIEGVAKEEEKQEIIAKEASEKANAANSSIPGWRSLHDEALIFGKSEIDALKYASQARIEKERALAKTYVQKYNPETNQTYIHQERRGRNWNTYLAKRNEEAQFKREARDWGAKKNKKAAEADALAEDYRANQKKLGESAEERKKRETARKDSLQDVIKKEKAEYEKKQKDRGFVRQYVAMENAAKSDAGVWFFLWVIRILFFTIEILPTIVKLKTPLGDYDRKLFYHEKSFALSLANNLEVLRQKEKIRFDNEIAIAKQVEKERYDQEISLNKDILQEIATKQQDIAKRTLKEWHKNEKAKLAPKVSIAQTPITAKPDVILPVVPNVPVSPSFDTGIPSTSHTIPNMPIVTQIEPSVLLRKQWRHLDAKQNEMYIFYNPNEPNNLHKIVEGKLKEKGEWLFDALDKNFITIDLSGKADKYKITSLTENNLSLVHTNGIKRLEMSAVN